MPSLLGKENTIDLHPNLSPNKNKPHMEIETSYEGGWGLGVRFTPTGNIGWKNDLLSIVYACLISFFTKFKF